MKHVSRADATLNSSTYKEKIQQANKEAAYTVVALAVIVVAWIVLGFGLANVNVQIFHTPLWVVGGTVGTWLVAIAACVFLAKKVFADFPFEDEEAETAATAPAPAAAAAPAAAGAATPATAAATAPATNSKEAGHE